MAAECLFMVYTVYKGVDLGMGVVAADFDDTAQNEQYKFAFYRHFRINPERFVRC